MGKQNGKRYHFLYCTTNLVNNKFYVGVHSTYNLKDGYLGSGKRLKRAVAKYGIENFKCEILEFFENREEVLKREKEIVNEQLLNDPFCMNLKGGGEGGLNFVSEESLKRIREGASKWIKNKWTNLDYREKQSKMNSKKMKNSHQVGKINYNTFEGKTHSNETKKKMSDKAKMRIGNKSSQFGSCWIFNNELKKNKKINLNDLDKWSNLGWIKGRKMKF